MLTADLADYTLSPVARATLLLKIEAVEVRHREYLATRPLMGKDGIVLKLFQDFESLCFAISKADGQITMEQLMDGSVYSFYRYKQLLMTHIAKKNSIMSTESD